MRAHIHNILYLVLPTLTHTHKGLDGVADVGSSMEHYDLMRSDWVLVSEMGLFKGINLTNKYFPWPI